jgi:hypothetical protein
MMSEQPERAAIGGEDQVPEDALGESDFADEHQSPTYADQMPGGPEGVAESETPQGLAGMESRTPGDDDDEQPE